jgi:hypothetical protein
MSKQARKLDVSTVQIATGKEEQVRQVSAELRELMSKTALAAVVSRDERLFESVGLPVRKPRLFAL